MSTKQQKLSFAPEFIKREKCDTISGADRDRVLQQLDIAARWVLNYNKLPPDLTAQLAKFEKRFFNACNDGLILNEVNSAHADGAPLNDSASPYGGNKSAFAVAAERLGMEANTVKDKYYEVLQSQHKDANGRPALSHTPRKAQPKAKQTKPRKAKAPSSITNEAPPGSTLGTLLSANTRKRS